ncbi:uncharacterized protein LOC110022999 [Phalaenopsis equestris]|uniref:uncharacterized protein LOC110022999 n=1 Tax=Phalaenopsis equestris TaxID=78828 RepID=UPI0009E58B55|nr:uncharacterized protein LOC110022999 [Phalaenopsis equestris]
MTEGLCGKRLEFEETIGSPPSAPSAKRSRFSNYGSPIRIAEAGVAAEDKVSVLLRMFPSMDRKVVENVLNSHDSNIDDAIKNLHALCLGETSVRNEPVFVQSKEDGEEGVINAQSPVVNAAVLYNAESGLELKETHGSSWVDIFVQEMMKAADWHDVRSQAMKILESFKQMIVVHSTSSKEQEIASLKEQLQFLLRDNQILKRAVAIQHAHNLESEEKLKEVQQLRNIISQYQEQVRTLELNNYTLKIHLQRAQEATSIPGRFHPDIF